MKTSTRGLAFLSQQEGCVLHVYKDQAGKDTIGVGHLLRPGEAFHEGITHEQALSMLATDVTVAEHALEDYLTVPVNQDQFDACVSLTFNIGTGGFRDSTVRLRINSSLFLSAADAFLMWCKREPSPGELIEDAVTGGMRQPRVGELVVDPGLLARRQQERLLFLGKLP